MSRRPRSSRPQRSPLRPVAGLLTLLAACALLAPACSTPWSGAGDATGTRAAIPVRKVDSIEFTVPAKGSLEAEKASGIAVPRVPTGALKVKEVVPEGTIVRKGDVVIRFDDTQLNIDLDNQRASYRSTERRMDKNKIQSDMELGSIGVMKDVATLERDNADAVKIVDEDIFSKLDILEEMVRKQDAKETIVFADASLELRGQYYDIEKSILDVERRKVEGDMGRVTTSLGNLVLRAPIGGLVLYKKNWRGSTVAVGDTLWPGNLILSLVDPSTTMLTAYVLEKDAAGVEKGAEARIRIDARPERTFHGKVESIAEVSRPIERNSPVKYSEVKISIDDAPPGLLTPGMKGEARIVTTRAERALVLPRSALRGDVEKPWVLVDDGGEPARRDVRLGPGDQVRVSVLEGVREGEMVILGGEDPGTPPASGAEGSPAAPGGEVPAGL